MKTAKLRNKNKKEEIQVTEEYSIKQMIIIIVILLAVFGVFYLITTLVVNNKTNDSTQKSATVLDSTKITMGHLLDRKESEYYVLATKDKTNNASTYSEMDYSKIYNNYLSDYKQLENALTIYRIDLDDALNKKYISDTSNITNNLSELKLNDDTLFEIKDGEIKDSFVGSDEIIRILSSLKES